MWAFASIAAIADDAYVIVITVLLALWGAKYLCTPRAFARKPVYMSSDGLKLKFVNDAKKCARGAALEDIPDVVDDLRACFLGGVSLPIAKRREQLESLLRTVTEHEDEILEALRLDLSRTGIEGLYYDIVLPKDEIRAMLKNLKSWTGRRRVWSPRLITWPSSQWVEKQPHGCALVCSSWNFPFMLSLVPLAGAIAAGNTVILKPSNDSRASATLLVKLVRESCDPRVVQCVGAEIPGNGIDVMQCLLKQKFDFIFFTGSSKVGKIVASAAAENLTPTVLELGGKNPVVVTDCADINLAAKQCMWGRMINCGQQCIAPEYVLCHESQVQAFQDACKHWANVFVPDASIEGSMARMGGPQGRMADVAKMLNDLRDAKIHADEYIVHGGACDVNSRMVEPTIVRCKTSTSPLLQEELFAPILCVLAYSDLKDAIDVIRSKPKPLTMYIFSRSSEKVRMLLDNTHAGGVTVNGTLMHCAHDELPFGGVGASGYGRYHGRYSVECFQREKAVLQKTRDVGDFGLITDPPLVYLPHAAWKTRVARFVFA